MNNEQTINMLNAMKLSGMARIFQSALERPDDDLTIDELVARMSQSEWDDRQNNRLDRLIRAARFRYPASFAQLNFRIKRNLDRNKVMRFEDCNWIKRKQNIIVTGPTGVGKSFIACALGNQACMFGYRVLYFNAAKLFAMLKLKKADGSYIKEVKRIQKQNLLILDDFGLEHLDRHGRLALLEIMEDRHGVESTVITSQMPIKTWHEIIGDATIADAICDRLIHSSHRIELKGDSVRKKFKDDLT